MAEQQYKRQTAFLCTARQLQSGTYVRTEGWDPSYLATDAGMVARLRMTGIVVDAAGTIIIDDGTGKVALRSFDGVLPALAVGDPVLVIGRPRANGDEVYVMVELLRKLRSPKWLQYYVREKSFFQSFIPEVPAEPAAPALEEPIVEKPLPVASAPTAQGTKASLIDIIRELDPGDGAAMADVLERYGAPDGEEKLQFLIAQGEVFELRAGKIKVLE